MTNGNKGSNHPITISIKKKYVLEMMKKSEDEAIRCAHIFADKNDDDIITITLHPAERRPAEKGM